MGIDSVPRKENLGILYFFSQIDRQTTIMTIITTLIMIIVTTTIKIK